MDAIRPAFSMWADYNRRMREVVARLTPEQLAAPAGYHRWPMWAVIGHTLCQRVFWLCDFLGEPGAETTRFTDAGHDCPGDDDLDTVLSADELTEAIDRTFRIVEHCLDTWTLDMLDEVIRRPEFGDDWVHTRGSVLQRVLTHDIYHCGEVNLVLGEDDQIHLWE